MDDIFVEMINGKLVIIYMDNILIFAKTKEELERITKWYWPSSMKGPIPKSQGMRILQIMNWISGYDHWRRENFHGTHQTHWNMRLANPINSKTS